MARGSPKRPLVALPRVGKPDGRFCCWVCQQDWPSRYDLVVDTVASTVRLDDSQPLALSRNELNVLQALIAAFPRFLTRHQLAEHTWDYRPDCEMPDASVVMGVAKKIGSILQGSRYTVERDMKLGVRLVDVDTLLRERGFDDHHAKKLVKVLTRETLAAVSSAQVAKTLSESKPVAPHRRTGKKKTGTKRERRFVERKRLSTKPKPKGPRPGVSRRSKKRKSR